jgi:hypothetical protein
MASHGDSESSPGFAIFVLVVFACLIGFGFIMFPHHEPSAPPPAAPAANPDSPAPQK